MKKALIFIVLACSCAVSPVLVLGAMEGKFTQAVGPEARWPAGKSFMERVHRECGSFAGEKLGECMVSVMERSGASPQATGFARRLENGGFMHAFRETGKVDIAYVTYPFRANENQGCLLVNGTPSVIDVDDFGCLVTNDLKRDNVYGKLASRFPAISLWPGDRFSTDFPVMEKLSDNGQRFHVGYRLLNGCHACEVLGSAVFAFDFDGKGKFMGTRLEGVTDTTKGEFSDPTSPIETAPDREFTLTLESNRTTGYQWQLAKPPDEKIIRLIRNEYRIPKTRLVGAGGKEVWTFKAVGKGKTEIFLKYVRPWEKNVPPVREAVFVIVVQ
jgi:predicted secreted protein